MNQKNILALLLLTLCATLMHAQPQYEKIDSINVEKWLNESRQLAEGESAVLFFANKLIGIPYVAHTLDLNKEERLVVNTRQLDCTTYVENVLALAVCATNKMYRFQQFCYALQKIRYIGGRIEYTARKHYFTTWINDNATLGLVEPIDQPNPPFSSTQIVDVDYMTTHPDAYAMLKAHPEWLGPIGEMEKDINGQKMRYIPAERLNNGDLLRHYVADGDILAIVTKKKGLDISHVGFAVWHDNNLHLLNASMLHKKVVDEPMTLYEYMKKHPTNLGIRVIHPTL